MLARLIKLTMILRDIVLRSWYCSKIISWL